jgi:hypothetical protein
MKRLALVAALLFVGEAGVHADRDIYTNMLKQPRGDDALHADAAVCDPGRARLSTNPTPTGSTTETNTIGSERLAGCMAATFGLPTARITSGANATSSVEYRRT